MLPEERILLSELKKRNKSVFEAVYREYFPLLKSFAFNYVVDEQKCNDIIQDLFLYLWNNLEKLTFNVSLKSYLLKATKNKCLNYLRDYKIKDKHDLQYLEASLQISHAELIEDDTLFNELENALKQLSPEKSRVIFQKYFENKKIDEIALLDNLSPNTVKKRLQRAKEILKDRLSNSLYLFYMFLLTLFDTF